MIPSAHSYTFGFCEYCDCLHVALADESGEQFAEMTLTIEHLREMLRVMEGQQATDSIGACQNVRPF